MQTGLVVTMMRNRWNLLLLVAATLVWAAVFYTGALAGMFWLILPALGFGAISTAVLCNALEAGPYARPLMALLPPALVSAPLVLLASPDRGFGYLPILLFLVPCMVVSGGFLLVASCRTAWGRMGGKRSGADGAPDQRPV